MGGGESTPHLSPYRIPITKCLTTFAKSGCALSAVPSYAPHAFLLIIGPATLNPELIQESKLFPVTLNRVT